MDKWQASLWIVQLAHSQLLAMINMLVLRSAPVDRVMLLHHSDGCSCFDDVQLSAQTWESDRNSNYTSLYRKSVTDTELQLSKWSYEIKKFLLAMEIFLYTLYTQGSSSSAFYLGFVIKSVKSGAPWKLVTWQNECHLSSPRPPCFAGKNLQAI